MKTKELVKQITILIHEEFEQWNKRIETLLSDIKKGQKKIHRDMATKEDIQSLRKTIDAYMKVTLMYKEKQKLLEEDIDAILEYLGVSDN